MPAWNAVLSLMSRTFFGLISSAMKMADAGPSRSSRPASRCAIFQPCSVTRAFVAVGVMNGRPARS